MLFYKRRTIQFTVPETVVLTCIAPELCVRLMFTVPEKELAPVKTLAEELPFLAKMVKELTAPELANHPSIMLLLEGRAWAKTKPWVPEAAV